MSDLSTNPNVLTTFDHPGGSPDSSGGGFFRNFLDFVRPTLPNAAATVDGGGGNTVEATSPSRSASPAPVVRVSSIGQLLGKRGTRSLVTSPTTEGADNLGNYRKYWMPDDQCKECYDCGTLFTTFKRRHHCRLCGQIFCYDCCSDMITGIIPGNGNTEVQLRVCKYCLELKSKNLRIDRRSSSVHKGLIFSPGALERPAVEPQESPIEQISDFLQEELKEEDVWKINLHFMWSLFRHPSSPVQPHSTWQRFRYYPETYHRADVLRWLSDHLTKPEEGERMLTAWIETERLEPVDKSRVVYRVGRKDDYNENTVMLYEQTKKEPADSDTNWIHRMIIEARTQSFDNPRSTISSFVHVDLEKDLPPGEEYWQTGAAESLPTSQGLDEGSASELATTVDSLNRTSRLFAKPPADGANVVRSPETYGLDIFSQCLRQEKTPNPSLVIPSFGDATVLDPVGSAASTPSDLTGTDQWKVPPERGLSALQARYEAHMGAILEVLVARERIPDLWTPILKRVVSEAAADVTPNPMLGDAMDIRKYVKFKKVHGQPEQSFALDGYVCSKTVAHKKMRPWITAPKIMLLSGSISYQRVVNKLTSLNPVHLQEKEFLSKITDRISSFEPDVLIVEKSVSQIAKDHLLEKGITLILNLKPGQIDKLARCVEGDVIQNLENITFIPATGDLAAFKNRLGHCREFRASFMKGFYGAKKPLLFFTGCDKQLVKTVMLFGESKQTLKRVKKVASTLLLALYNTRLELHYMKRCQLLLPPLPSSSPPLPHREQQQSLDVPGTPTLGTSPSSSTMEPAVVADPDSVSEESEPTQVEQLVEVEEHPVEEASNQQPVEEASRPGEMERLFSILVDTTIFSLTPFCHPSVPYLYTGEGNECPTRPYFDQYIYNSDRLSPVSVLSSEDPLFFQRSPSPVSSPGHGSPSSPHNQQPVITSFTEDDFSFYRAFGFWEFEKERLEGTDDSGMGEECHPEAPARIKNRFEQNLKGKDLDCLDFYNHQKLLVLFSSFSVKSFNHPLPCISPWSLNMQFYSKNDLTLGLFLRDYCFQSTYQCPEQACKTETVDHERRFVHNGQRVSLRMSRISLVLESVASTPLMWSVCNKCLVMSEISVVSKELWNYSFAKFLELKFYERELVARGACPHPYHRNHTNFFALGSLVASFTRCDVRVVEISPLPSKISFERHYTDIMVSNGVLLNETVTKVNTALKAVTDKLEEMSGIDEAALREARTSLAAEEVSFRQKMADLALVTSDRSPIDTRRGIFRLQSELVLSVDTWNGRLAAMKRKPAVSSTKTKSQSSEVLNSLEEVREDEVGGAGKKPAHRRVLSEGSGLSDLRPQELLHKTTWHSLEDLRVLQRRGSKMGEHCGARISEGSGVKEPTKKSKTTYSKLTKRLFNFSSFAESHFKKIENLFPADEHHRITGCSQPCVLVCEKHFTSIIAYALSCEKYRSKLQLLKPDHGATGATATGAAGGNAPLPARPSSKSHTSNTSESEDKVGYWLTVTSNGSGGSGDTTPELRSHKRNKSTELISPADELSGKANHVEVEFADGATKFFCKFYFAAEFDRLRTLLMPGEALHDFIHSLSYCSKWQAKGGKSGLSFNKSQDDRWVVKEMSRLELQALLMFVPSYIEYVVDGMNKRPTLLAKIVAACTVGYSNVHGSMKQDVIIMENIFYNCTPSLIYDLKGSNRNRLAEESEEVLLDTNYLKHIVSDPIYLRPHSKTFLREAVNCDTAFLAAQSIIDYSLLVGVCGDQLVVGIIDYIRKFTFDKKVEMIFKTNMIGSAGKMPTIVSPEMYRERFYNQIERYFPLVPDRWTGMGSDLQYS